MKSTLIAAVLAAHAACASAQIYQIDPSNTSPSFEADHIGISTVRGKFTRTNGTVTLDRVAKTGSLDITIDADSIDFGNPALTKHAKSRDMFNVEQWTKISYKSNSMTFNGDAPAFVNGQLTMLGVTKPVKLTINRFKCLMHPRLKREVCGADASAQFKRTDFGLNYDVPASSPEVKLSIQVEAVRQ